MSATVEEGRRGDLLLGTTPRLLRTSARRYGDREAILDSDGDGPLRLSFTELHTRVEQLAAGLIALSVRPGDRVAIWAPNSWRWIAAALAVHSVGGVLVPINTRYKGDEAAYLLRKSGARLLLCVTGFLGIDCLELLRRAAEPPELDATVVLAGEAPPGAMDLLTLLRRGQAVSSDEVARRADAVRPEDPLDLLFTSGTTGRPKGVLCTHGQTLRAFLDWSDRVGLVAGDRYLAAMPFFHTFGYKAGWLAALMSGATLLPQPVFDIDAILARVAKDRISVLPGPPALYQSLLARPDLGDHDLSSLRLAVTGAAMIPVDLIERMRRELGFRTVLTGYGLTEATGVTTLCRDGDDPVTVAKTSGRPIPGVEVRVVGEDGQPLPAGAPGEVLVRGYTVMSGYFEDAAATALAIDAEGFLHTGDIGVLDAAGCLRITDRKKDMFIVGGFNAYPAEIENVLLQHAGVLQAAVIGIPDERLGEVGMAFVVPRPEARLDAEALYTYCRPRLANFKVPRRFALVAELPRNASGKVLKDVLRERAARERVC